MKYFTKDYDSKGIISIGAYTKIRKSARTTLSIYDEKKKRDFILMQPESKDINYAEEKKLGNCVYIDDWIKELNTVIKHLQDSDKP
jgi:hypothetical protein